MKKLLGEWAGVFLCCIVFVPLSCNEEKSAPSRQELDALNLKRGKVISCSPANQAFGLVHFETSCSPAQNANFNLAIKLLHSFEYDEAEKVFAKIIDTIPDCAMAYWGVAMSNFHALWTPPTPEELKKGSKAIEIARALKGKTEKEKAYVESIASYFNDWENKDHRTRCLRYEKAMEKLHATYPSDKETSIFYALALNAAADKADKTYSKQIKAGQILSSLYPNEPDHPGIVHYLIHTYDVPELAKLALPAARRYASVAPSSAHALHMPSHIFIRLGLWNESIQSNLTSIASAQCYATEAGINGHWDEELHGLDYLVYAHLQTGNNQQAMKQWQYLRTIHHVEPVNFKVAYAFAAIPSRYLLENRLWKEAANLEPVHANLSWENFPWQKAIIIYTRLLGAVNTGDLPAAKLGFADLNRLHELLKGKDPYQANQVLIQIRSSEAWINFKEGNVSAAVQQMQVAADMEDKTGKHPVTPCEVLPQRELQGDLYMQLKDPVKALQAYELNLANNPGRFNGLYGAGLAAEKSGNIGKANAYFTQLLAGVDTGASGRPEVAVAKQYLETH